MTGLSQQGFNNHFDRQKGKEQYLRLFIIPYALGEKNVPWGLVKRTERLAKKCREDYSHHDLYDKTRETAKLVILRRMRANKLRKTKQRKK